MDSILKNIIKYLILFVSVFTLLACGGGGGGGGEGRTRETAVRIIQGSIDSGPVVSQVTLEAALSARFAEASDYTVIPQGPQNFLVSLQNSPSDQVGSVSFTAMAETEYTIFVVGETRDGRRRAVLIEEPVVRPDGGFARVQVLNGVIGSRSIEVRGSDFSATALEGQSSGFIETAFGPQTLNVFDRSGNLLETRAVDIVDTGEITLLVAGSTALGVEYTRVFEDLD